MEHSLTAPQTAGEGYNYEVATWYEDSTKWFPTLTQALDYYESLPEAASLWDHNGASPEQIKWK